LPDNWRLRQTGVTLGDLYEIDFYAWANEQARLIRDGRLADADLENIAEEIESMGRSEKRELVTRFGPRRSKRPIATLGAWPESRPVCRRFHFRPCVHGRRNR
jgi:hypothetical protein